MRIAIIKNKYYSDAGMDYCFDRLEHYLSPYAEIAFPEEFVCIGGKDSTDAVRAPFDGAVFWDKDVSLAYTYESSGVRLFNRAAAVEVCDSKQKTALRLAGRELMPKTVFAPLRYSSGEAQNFLNFVASSLGFPLVAKLAYGSQGKQVQLIENDWQLESYYRENQLTPHLYQQALYEGFGKDTRVYIVGGKAAASVERENADGFLSNVASGGTVKLFGAPKALLQRAVRMGEILGLDYGAIDFIYHKGEYYFIEANSNAYFRAAEGEGAKIAEVYAKYIIEVLKHDRG